MIEVVLIRLSMIFDLVLLFVTLVFNMNFFSNELILDIKFEYALGRWKIWDHK